MQVATGTGAGVRMKGERRNLIDVGAPWVAVAAAVCLTATGEYQLARLAGWSSIIAAMLPVTIDIYVVTAIRQHRDVAPALAMMMVANALYHLAERNLFGTDGRPGHLAWWLIVGCTAVAPLVIWRIHRIVPKASRGAVPALSRHETETTQDETRPVAPAATPDPALPVASRAETGQPRPTTGQDTTRKPATDRDETATSWGAPLPAPVRDRTPRVAEAGTPPVVLGREAPGPVLSRPETGRDGTQGVGPTQAVRDTLSRLGRVSSWGALPDLVMADHPDLDRASVRKACARVRRDTATKALAGT